MGKFSKANLSPIAKYLNKKFSFSIYAKKGKDADVKEKKKKADVIWSPPNLDANTPSPIYGGSTGGLMNKQKYEFEMSAGGYAFMRQGPNLLKLARKEQCLELSNDFRLEKEFKKKIIVKKSISFYRVLPSGEVQYLYPADGVYPEKKNKGRKGVNQNLRRIGQNVDPGALKFSSAGVTQPFEI